MIYRLLFVLFFAASLFAESFPPAKEILAFAREQLPKQPIRMTGALRDRAPNGYVKKARSVEMELRWGDYPASAVYRIQDEQTGSNQTLNIQWMPAGPEYRYFENEKVISGFNPGNEIDGLGITWADLSFSFLWSRDAETAGTDKKLGRDCFIITVPCPAGRLFLWIEQGTGRLLGAKEKSADGQPVKEIKIVSVKEFDGLWMVKDIDILRPAENGRTSLRINSVDPL